MISVIVPVYNTQRYVGRCIESVSASGYTDYELLLIDDGSTDHSPDICESYSRKDSRIKLIRQKHMGVSAARNRGIKESRGEWIVFVDSDDLISEEFLGITAQKEYEEYDLLLFDLAHASGKRSGAAHSLPAYHYGEKDRAALIRHLLYMRQLVKGGNTSFCSPCAKAYRRSVIERCFVRFPEDIVIGEDRIFNIEYLSKAKSCLYLPEPAYIVRARPDSVMHSFLPDFLENDMRYQQRLAAVLEKEGFLTLCKRAYYSSVLTNMTDVLIRGIFNPNSKRTYEDNIHLCRRMQKNRIYRDAMPYAVSTGRLSRRVLFFFYKMRCYKIVELICRVSYRALNI